MESKEKKESVFKRIKRAYRKFMYKEGTIKQLEEYDKIPFVERFSQTYWIYMTVLVLVAILGIKVVADMRYTEEKEGLIKNHEFLEEQLDGRKENIQSGELTKYMIDNINNSYVKIAMTKIGGDVAYSLTYRYDSIPSGEMASSTYMTSGVITSILINGYPNKTYKEMDLNTEEEAYLATQLAIYEFISMKQYTDIANGEFSIDSITASQTRYEDMVERVKAKAKELLYYAIENPFEENLLATYGSQPITVKQEGNNSIYGPYSLKVDTDNVTKTMMGDAYSYKIEIEPKSMIENTTAVVTDENGKELKKVESGQEFYIKINSTDKIFTQLKFDASTYVLQANIYETTENKKKYVALQPYEVTYKGITSIVNKLDSGPIEINFKNYNGDNLWGIKYNIYDEKGNLIQKVDVDDCLYNYKLPYGKYYIEIYEMPDGYFVEKSKFDFEVNNQNQNVLNVEIDTVIQ